LHIAMISQGDGRERSTWSGTPRNISSALRDLGHQIRHVDATPSSILRHADLARYQARRFAGFLRTRGDLGTPLVGSLLTEERSDYAWSLPRRRHSGETALRALKQSPPPDAVLHMSPMALPLPELITVPQYAYVDSTFDSLLKHCEHPFRFPPGFTVEVMAAERQGLGQCAAVFTASAYIRDHLINSGTLPGSRVDHVGVGLGRVRAFDGLKDFSRPKLLFVARHSFHRKGGDLAVAAFRRLREQIPGAELTLVVGEDVRRRLVDEPGITTYGNAIQTSLLQSLFEKANALLMPALNEPLGLVYYEALACGAPVIGLHRNVIPELAARGAAISVEAHEAETLAERIIEIYGDPKLAAALGHSARRFANSQVSWTSVAERIEARLLERSPAVDP
jgi:glycosyltransferase involved in cell wall biosynthesis